MDARRCLRKLRGSITVDHVAKVSASPVPATGCQCQRGAGAAVLSGCVRPATAREGRLTVTARVRHTRLRSGLLLLFCVVAGMGCCVSTSISLSHTHLRLFSLVCKVEPRGLIARRVTEMAQSTLDMVSTAVDYPLCEYSCFF